MNVYYDMDSKTWYHNDPGERTFGGLKKPIPSSSSVSEIFFNLQLKDQKIGPLIGIMTSRNNTTSLAGNRSLFINIQHELLNKRALSFIFSYDEVHENGSILGYIYLPNKGAWIKALMPYPDIIYNRIPNRKAENNTCFHKSVKLFKDANIPFFNPGFIDKYSLSKILASTPTFSKYTPTTILVESYQALQLFFQQYSDIYLKPRKLARGRDIYRIYKDQNKLILKSQSEIIFIDNLESLIEYLGTDLYKGVYIAQQTIHPMLYENKRYDFRILSHWNPTKSVYEVTGVGIRASHPSKITTHLAYGGCIIPFDSLRNDEHELFISKTVTEIGKILTEEYGFFGEFSIDAGISSEGKYYIFEVNSKPMSFDEEKIEARRLRKLCNLFIRSVGF